jgi:hypothetical protein
MILNITTCIFIIVILHTVWNYIKDTFTLKKKKCINHEVEKYRQIMEESFANKPIHEDTDDSMQKEESSKLIEQDLELFLQNNI